MQNIFKNHIEKCKPSNSSVYELKISKQPRFLLSRVADHQIEGLLSANTTGLYHKIQDQPFGHGGNRFYMKKPFDCFYLKDIRASVVIWFYTPRAEKVFYDMRVQTFLEIKESHKMKSITEEDILKYKCGKDDIIIHNIKRETSYSLWQ